MTKVFGVIYLRIPSSLECAKMDILRHSMRGKWKEERKVAAAVQEFKVLVLGPKGSGKSTLMTQMRLMHPEGPSADARTEVTDAQKEAVFSYIVKSMREILFALPKLELVLDPSNNVHRDAILGLTDHVDPSRFQAEALEPVRCLWKDEAVKAAVSRAEEFHLRSSAAYFLNALGRVLAPSYMPTEEDCVRSRERTQGIGETTIRVYGNMWKLLDMNCQTGDWKKWIHHFENVMAVMFVADVSDYDQVTFADESVNRLQETLELFDSICNSQWFSKTSVVLLLNKADLFEEKLPQEPLGNHFPEYVASDKPHDALNYLRTRFTSRNQSPGRHIWCLSTNLRHNHQVTVQCVADSLNEVYLMRGLQQRGLL
ncbi:heterotrimeric G protein alpha subunit B [Coprinopsis sp. MPI-PUGE-AT-0042]|nr:heterotrimeric G protein alpha subunit B [Coprinopsis sp. MPI-PUGE-AT-0042]